MNCFPGSGKPPASRTANNGLPADPSVRSHEQRHIQGYTVAAGHAVTLKHTHGTAAVPADKIAFFLQGRGSASPHDSLLNPVQDPVKAALNNCFRFCHRPHLLHCLIHTVLSFSC